MDQLQRDVLHLPFDPLDVPRDQFIVAGEAWQKCRSSVDKPERYGIFEMNGWWFIWGNVIREVLAFNKVEILPIDPKMSYVSKETVAGDPAFDELRRLYETEPRLHVPAAWLT